ncbi:MAG: TIGR04282 family arsenosugar biosynthesis glycosyltransferase [Pirellulales bacterium]|nr:TIGR04282 family arsenosugar biosynthesis glycosyltransferase [Pirellulales bacterium]
MATTRDPGPPECLGLLAKYWEPGKVKTRLARSVGSEKAARIYQSFVATTMDRLAEISNARFLAYSPDDDATRAAFATACPQGWSLVAQSGGQLGDRMADFFDARFRQGAQRVVLLGTDSPNLPRTLVQAAFERLKTCQVVLGPTGDGGYYLVGAAGETPRIFGDIPWSTAAVLPTTRLRLEQTGTSYSQLDSWYDVDEIGDLQRLIEDLQDQRRDEPELTALLKNLQQVMDE